MSNPVSVPATVRETLPLLRNCAPGGVHPAGDGNFSGMCVSLRAPGRPSCPEPYCPSAHRIPRDLDGTAIKAVSSGVLDLERLSGLE
ncbi:hypothetical protein GCM10027262_67960 [Nocardia tengchongensis]